MNEAIFLLGLPGSGKSTFILEFLKSHPNYQVVSADNIRVNHPNYNPKDPEAIHEECVRLAEMQMYDLTNPSRALGQVNVIMDGGGINNSYTTRIINVVKSYGYKIKTVFIDTPVDICILRNKERILNGERFVPASSIIDKSYRLKASVNKLSSVSDEFEVVKYFSDKHIFVDMDGTLAEYQQLSKDEYGDINFVEYGVFKQSKPITCVIDKLRELSQAGRRLYIVSASPNSICNVEKKEWVNKHLPFIHDEDIYFVGKKEFKYVFLYQLINKLKLSPSDCMAIDDDHKVLDAYSRLHINSMHTSFFLTNY